MHDHSNLRRRGAMHAFHGLCSAAIMSAVCGVCAAAAAGESAMHLHVAAWYVLTGRPQLGQAELRLIPGSSVTLRGLAKDLDDWSRIIAGDPKNAGSLQDAFDRGRLTGAEKESRDA